MASQRDTANRIGSVKNIQKITSAMQMVAAARLRRAEQRIEALRPYADTIQRMTRQAAEAAGNVPQLPILDEHEEIKNVGLLLVTGDRGLAGAFNSQIVRSGIRARAELAEESKDTTFYAVGRRGDSSLNFRGIAPKNSYIGFTDRPGFVNAREIAEELMADYIDGNVDQVDIVYNSYISPLTQVVTRQRILPLQQASILEGGLEEDSAPAVESESNDKSTTAGHALWLYEPDPEELLKRLIPDFVEITVFRALLESAASELGARMTAMRSASDNAGEMIENLTLEMNRQRQAAITQEILEVVGGAEGV
ncbi:MAG TPA: ATP synthase F1 subunit gamma [Solirubrobacterales bacterium]|jgi:F-type H+-transporting ATPase subunit gamma|nr:ATP synthase F1 subunit gamma [Solirubrobacterales bacterium]